MASSKAFQASRKPQYRRAKPRSPLASLNGGKAETAGPLSKRTPQASPQMIHFQAQENIYEVRRRSGCDGASLSPDGVASKPENKDLIKILNKTLSPVGTPERFKRLMPHIYQESPLSAAGKAGTPVLSVTDALALIDSDLSRVSSSPRDGGGGSSSGCSFSDSLGSSPGSKPAALPDACEQRLTFFVSKGEVAGSKPARRAPLASATVTKARAPAEASGSSGRKIRKSKRRLLERTLELSESSSSGGGGGSGPGTPTLPVIDVSPGVETLDQPEEPGGPGLGRPLRGLPPAVSSPLSASPGLVSFSLASPLPADASIRSPSPLSTSSPLHPQVCAKPSASPPPGQEEELFPIHVAAKSKKRKSEEFLKSDGKLEDAGKSGTVKRTRAVAWKPEACGSGRERRSSTSQRRTGERGVRV